MVEHFGSNTAYERLLGMLSRPQANPLHLVSVSGLSLAHRQRQAQTTRRLALERQEQDEGVLQRALRRRPERDSRYATRVKAVTDYLAQSRSGQSVSDAAAGVIEDIGRALDGARVMLTGDPSALLGMGSEAAAENVAADKDQREQRATRGLHDERTNAVRERNSGGGRAPTLPLPEHN